MAGKEKEFVEHANAKEKESIEHAKAKGKEEKGVDDAKDKEENRIEDESLGIKKKRVLMVKRIKKENKRLRCKG
ncbi:hypothetical protein V6N12_055785 [Hibiscus sabdariffa]|uniref:Uncharacterized protein n=1 Tax=Hibiscus sabdariffa TaxID=183260 RepID=A0ABR2AIZ8_9ROSI